MSWGVQDQGTSIVSIWLCLVAQLCPTLCDPMDYSPPCSSVHGDSPGKSIGVGWNALLQGVFPTQGLNPGLPHCRRILYHLRHQGNSNGIQLEPTFCFIDSCFFQLIFSWWKGWHGSSLKSHLSFIIIFNKNRWSFTISDNMHKHHEEIKNYRHPSSLPEVSLIWMLIPFLRAPFSWLNLLPRTPSPNTVPLGD